MGNLSPAQAAAEIAALINKRPHSPHVIEIEAIIARIGATDCAGPEDEEILPASAFDFKGEPVSFAWSAPEIVGAILQPLLISVALMQRDVSGAKTVINSLIAEDDAATCLAEMGAEIDAALERCRALLAMLECGQARFLITRAHIEHERHIAAPVAPGVRATVLHFAMTSALTLELRRVRLAHYHAEWDEVEAEPNSPQRAALSEQTDTLQKEFQALTARSLARSPATMDEFAQRVEIALAYCDMDGGKLAGLASECNEERSLAQLLEAAAAITGAPFAVKEGRAHG